MKTYSIDLLVSETKILRREFKAKTEEQARDEAWEYLYSNEFINEIDANGKTTDIERFVGEIEEVTE